MLLRQTGQTGGHQSRKGHKSHKELLLMRASKFCVAIFVLGFFLALPARPDTIILHDGSSYTGQFGAPGAPITFTDAQGVQYTFPRADVQSLVFTSTNAIVSLRSGKVYSGTYTAGDPLDFTDSQGINYQFPIKDVASLVFARSKPAAAVPAGGNAKVIPVGSEITINTDEQIDSKDASTGQLYSATVSQDIQDASGGIAIPAGTPAKLVVRDITGGGAVHSPELVLDLFSITVKGQEYRVVSADVDVNSKTGVGANRRTAEFGGGGAAIGALLGGIFGGGKGAGIGAAAGGGGGLLTQVFTRGKQVRIPAESSLTFRLDRTLVLRPKS
jgi:hypothetical protein